MTRTNIFELLAENNTIGDDARRLNGLFAHTKCFELNYEYYHEEDSWTLKEFVNSFCFSEWKNRHRCIDVKDFLNTIRYDEIFIRAKENSVDDFLTLIEIIYNFWHMAVEHCAKGTEYLDYSKLNNGVCTAKELKSIMDECLSEYNQKAFYFPKEERCIVVENSPQVTAAAEASDPEIAIEIVRYNHRQLAGDIIKKKAILKTLGDYLEGRKKEISNINATLYKNITGALNNLNIRHNNTNPENKSYYHKAMAEMPQKELESHYDDLYQLILLAILEMDNVQRQRDMSDLIQKVCEKEKA